MSPNSKIADTDPGGDSRLANILSMELAALDHFMNVNREALVELNAKRNADQQIIASLTCLDIESNLIASSLAHLKATASKQQEVSLNDTIASLECSRENVRAAVHDLHRVQLMAANYQQQVIASSNNFAQAQSKGEIFCQVMASLARARAAFQQHENELSAAQKNIAAHQFQDLHILVAAMAVLVVHNQEVITSIKAKTSQLRAAGLMAPTPVPSMIAVPTPRQSSTNSDLVSCLTAPEPSELSSPEARQDGKGRRQSNKHTAKSVLVSMEDDPLVNGLSFANLTLDDTSDESESEDQGGVLSSKVDAAQTCTMNSPPPPLPLSSTHASSKKKERHRGRRRGSKQQSTRSNSSLDMGFAAGISNDPPAPIASMVFPPLDSDFATLSIESCDAMNKSSSSIDPSLPKVVEKPITLPIDEHKDEILRTVKNQRVTIIHGETGCGKSSRVPCFLLRAALPDPRSRAREAKMMISQPRRIAAKALAERVRSCEPDLKDKIGLRMGHGVREYETSATRAWFVTTGYLVRVLANNPGLFDSHTHLIIDEVHERSIDTDILCLLCRRLLHSHPTIRLVLMSATMAAELYGQYFGVPQPPIFVGARRFPIKEFFVEDLTSSVLSASIKSKGAKLVQDVFNECEKSKCKSAPSSVNMDKLYRLATEITASVGNHGSSVLIFVPGMSDIEAIIELIEKLTIPGISFLCLPIHSDVPFEDQLAVFEAPKNGEVKVIIATNAAESSLTLPDCDHVVCLGLCKQITYDSASHRQMLVPTWISRASATQRAGRTGRVREGNVYRLYSRKAFEQYMEPFEKGELVRSPLDTTILSLRDMLNEPVTPILLDCLEPPDISTIERSFQSLHESKFITHPSDEGVITSMGSLAVALGIDLTLGNFVGLGIQFGVAAEAIQLAAILSFPQSPWAISNPLYHDVGAFNEIASKTFTSRSTFDAGLYSEPLAIVKLLHEYSISKDRSQFIWKHCVSGTRMRHLYGTVQSLKQRVAEHLRIDSVLLEIESLPLNHTKINILRILQVWIFHDTIIVQKPAKRTTEVIHGGMSITLAGPPITRQHLNQILDEQRHKFEILNTGQINMQGSFRSSSGDFTEHAFDTRFASHALEKNIVISSYLRLKTQKFFVPGEVWHNAKDKLENSVRNIVLLSIDEIFLQQSSGGNKRGMRGRACGAWQPFAGDGASATNDDTLQVKCVVILTFFLPDAKQRKALESIVENTFLTNAARSSLFCSISESNTKTSFSLSFKGECHGMSKTDLCDMFAAPDLAASTSGSIQQSIAFPRVETRTENDLYPLIEDAPEGARLMTVLASTRRKDNFIRFNDGLEGHEGSVAKYIDVVLPKNMSINGNKWKKKDSRGNVFVQENCVPAAALPISHDLEIFGCCANTLELRGGACRVEGITLLPPGRTFVGLALLAYGVNPRTGSSRVLDFEEDECEDNEYVEEIVNAIVEDGWGWMKENDRFSDLSDRWRAFEALQFHSECLQRGETLECQPELIESLCALFDMVDGQPMIVWDIDTLATLRTKSRTRETARLIPVADRDQLRRTAKTQPMMVRDEERPIIPSNQITSKKKRTTRSAVAGNKTKNR